MKDDLGRKLHSVLSMSSNIIMWTSVYKKIILVELTGLSEEGCEENAESEEGKYWTSSSVKSQNKLKLKQRGICWHRWEWDATLNKKVSKWSWEEQQKEPPVGSCIKEDQSWKPENVVVKGRNTLGDLWELFGDWPSFLSQPVSGTLSHSNYATPSLWTLLNPPWKPVCSILPVICEPLTLSLCFCGIFSFFLHPWVHERH